MTDSRIARIEAGLRPKGPFHSRRELPARLADRMATLRVPGVSVAVIHQGKIAWTAGYGVKEAGANEPITPQTLFQAASISKPVAVAGALRLVEQGLLDLDEDVNRYLTSWKVPANGSWQPRITIRHLMSHTAGLTVHGFPGYNRSVPIPTAVQVLGGEPPANTARVEVNLLPGVQERYSGGGTTVLQQLMVDVTGTPFPELMRSLVLDPAGMADSTYEQPLPERLWDRAATGHQWGNLEPVPGRWHVYPEMAAAGLWTTPADLCRFALAIQNATLHRKETVAAMLTPHFGGDFGMGFQLRRQEGHLRFQHGGSNSGYKNMLAAYADQGLGACVMTNSDAGSVLFEELLGAIASEYEWPGYLPAEAPAGAAADPAALARLEGEYELRPGYRFSLRLNQGQVELLAPHQPPVPLRQKTESTFVAEPLNLELLVDGDNVTVSQDGRVFTVQKLS